MTHALCANHLVDERKEEASMLIIDRFEGKYAIIETSDGMANIPVADLPPGAKEGDVLTISIDKKGTANRRENIGKLMNDLFKD